MSRWGIGSLDDGFLSRFWSKVGGPYGDDECWLWEAGISQWGYGTFMIFKGVMRSAHRVAYELERGPIPDGQELDHLCRVRRCVNPRHLEPVTRKENLARGIQANRAKTHCPQGHPYNEANTYRYKNRVGGIGRRCRVCTNASQRRYQERKKAVIR